MDNALYDYSPLPARRKLTWPDAAQSRVLHRPEISSTIRWTSRRRASSAVAGGAGSSQLRLAGLRGAGRDLAHDRRPAQVQMRASVLLNADCCERYPQIIDAGKKRNWCWVAHGKNNSIFQAGMSAEDERKYLKECCRHDHERDRANHQGVARTGAHRDIRDPAPSEGARPHLRAGLVRDDQPFPLKVPGMMSSPVLDRTQRCHNVRRQEFDRRGFVPNCGRPVRSAL